MTQRGGSWTEWTLHLDQVSEYFSSLDSAQRIFVLPSVGLCNVDKNVSSVSDTNKWHLQTVFYICRSFEFESIGEYKAEDLFLDLIYWTKCKRVNAHKCKLWSFKWCACVCACACFGCTADSQQVRPCTGKRQETSCSHTHREREMSEHLNTSVCCVLHSTGVCLNRSDFSRVKKTTHGSSVW